jgi:hypothetical protein
MREDDDPIHQPPEPLLPTSIHVQQLCRVRTGEHDGMGVFEPAVIGRRSPSGFASILDGAA